MIIDLRSDTLTRPTPEMLAAMTAAPVGDDVYGEDPTVEALERRVATMLGHEAGLFCATGSLTNMLGVWLHTEPGTEVICDGLAHIVRAEMGGHALNHGVTTRTWSSSGGRVDPELVAATIADPAGPFLVRTSLIELENTHNFGGGTIMPIETVREIRRIALAHGVRTHLDGARLWNAHVATGVPLAEWGAEFDSVSVCLSKGLGAPVGSVLVGSAEDMARARIQRKRLGAGWRQAGVLAAAADYALTHHLAALADDHIAARALADEVRIVCEHAVGEVETNIVIVRTGVGDAAGIAARAAERGVLVSVMGSDVVRAVTHRDVTLEQCREAGAVLASLLG